MATPSDNRRTARRSVRYRATIENVLDGSLIPCQIHDVSATGAKLQVAPGTDIPEQFVLHLAPGGASRRVCKRVWRDGNVLGALFMSDGAITG
ncbi:PilZ domain-containing protein [Phreatobacter aquaticus]|uniref:PilZ domain-containing protein n=1 Tax=Phreatobacter aquaticus TaxID=2570229 RepID=A0A4D7QFD9_9HYPH|nr:PilZ domain-containing protein [Phreatobacter aquaticus]QCK85565.1 PilZ domain-containing protein [Phreatobacter aquaticus]